MNKINPKKIMEIIYIFILPLLFLIFCVTFQKQEVISGDITTTTYIFEYNIGIVNSWASPIKLVFEYILSSMGLQIRDVFYVIIDYINLWFIMFITWHLFYLFFDTLMHKVLLRKE